MTNKGERTVKSKIASVISGLLIAAVLPCFFFALKLFESWSLEYLYYRGEVGIYGYGVIQFLEMALFALAIIFLAYHLFAPKRWSVPCLGIGFLMSVILLAQSGSIAFFDSFDMLRAFLTTAYGVIFLLALTGKVSV